MPNIYTVLSMYSGCRTVNVLLMIYVTVTFCRKIGEDLLKASSGSR